MRIKKINIAWIIFLLSCVHSGLAQGSVILKASTDRSTILIGEHLQLSLDISIPLGYDVQWPAIDSFPHFQVLEKGKIDSTTTPEQKTFHQELTITSFDSGVYYIPSLAFHVSNTSYLSDSIRVDIHFSDFDPSHDYHDLKDILEIINPYTRYVVWAGHLCYNCAGALLFVALTRKKQIMVEEKPVFVSKLSPYDEAIAALAELQKQKLAENGQVKSYYTGLNNILRLFMLRRFQVASLEKTNEEMILQLKRLNMNPGHFSKLAETLRMSDFVKFAKYQPAPDENDINFEVIRTSIDTT